MIYLDWAATSKPDNDIYKQSMDIALSHWGNPSSIHEWGKESRYYLEKYRSRAAKTLNCRPDQLILTSGGTESNNLAILSIIDKQLKAEIVLSSLEHPSVSKPVQALSKFQNKIRMVNPDDQGIIKPEALLKRLTPDTRMVTIMAVHNTTGVIQPIKELVQVVREFEQGKRPIHFHCDMVQAAGKIKINLNDLDLDSASFSGHKIGAPRGAGLLFLKKVIPSMNFGGGQEQGLRSGTESLQNMAAMTLALEKYSIPGNEWAVKIQHLSESLIQTLKDDFPSIQFNPPAREQNKKLFVSSIINFSIPPLPGEVLHRILDVKGISVSHGSACAANGRKKPEDLHAMGIHPKTAHCSIRVSLGPETTDEEIKTFINILKEETKKLGI